MNRIVITGPTGAIGTAIIRQCVDEGIEVYAIVRKNSNRIVRIENSPQVHIIECDLSELKDLPVDNIPICDVFYHLGWGATIGDGRNDMDLQTANIQYTLDAVRLANRLGCNTFVGTGSQAEYGRFEGKLNELVPAFPENGYGIAKLCAGQMSAIECSKFDMRHIWVRILSVYGPGDSDKTMITTTINKLLNKERASFTKAEQMWDYLYSEDAAKALVLMGKSQCAKGVYCLGSGIAKPLREYIEELAKNISQDTELGFGDVEYGPKQVMYLCADIERLTKDTGFVPEVTFDEGIKKTIEWMKQRINYEEN
ncbi:MAG: NAD(P)-dependent oxidoreductase [Lachnospiraceae bacterium]|nr:NAD(P)-dependent oxidoreductase [Lachnospiraceae bacterium]